MIGNMIVVVIPAFNPGNKLLVLVDTLIQDGFRKIVIVDDGSNKDIDNIFINLKKKSEVDILMHSVNLGKGRALKTAFNHILNEYSQYKGVITVDADGQHESQDVLKCAECLAIHSAENKIILGCRNFDCNAVPIRSKIGNICTKYILRYLCNVHISDSQTGLRGIPMQLLPNLLSIPGERYEYEMNMLLDLIDLGGIIIEIPIATIYENRNNSSHFNPIRDSIKIYTIIIKYSLSSLMAAIIDNATFIALNSYVDNIYILTFIGRMLAAIFNFIINKKVVFKRKGNVWKQSLLYICLLMMTGVISAFSISMLTHILNIPIVMLKVLVELILYFLNFYIQKNYIFTKRGKKYAYKN